MIDVKHIKFNGKRIILFHRKNTVQDSITGTMHPPPHARTVVMKCTDIGNDPPIHTRTMGNA